MLHCFGLIVPFSRLFRSLALVFFKGFLCYHSARSSKSVYWTSEVSPQSGLFVLHAETDLKSTFYHETATFLSKVICLSIVKMTEHNHSQSEHIWCWIYNYLVKLSSVCIYIYIHMQEILLLVTSWCCTWLGHAHIFLMWLFLLQVKHLAGRHDSILLPPGERVSALHGDGAAHAHLRTVCVWRQQLLFPHRTAFLRSPHSHRSCEWTRTTCCTSTYFDCNLFWVRVCCWMARAVQC